MDVQDNQFPGTHTEQQQQGTNIQRVDGGKNVEEKDLKTKFLFGNDKVKNANAPGMEGEGMGGHHFGGDSNPPTGDDPHNPSQNAGHTNAFLAITEPLTEDTANNNFKLQEQQGEPDYQTHRPVTPYQDNDQQHPIAGD